LAVRGIENLRVCDMSAVPNITAGNTNAAAMMLGDRCADFIMGTALKKKAPCRLLNGFDAAISALELHIFFVKVFR